MPKNQMTWLSARDVEARDALLALADLMDEMANGATA